MILTDYYLMQELKVLKSHRFDCIASTGKYEPFEQIAQRSRNKRFFCYCNSVTKRFAGQPQRKADKAIINRNNISSVFIPDSEQPLIGYGDTNGTTDGLLFLFNENDKQLEIFVARGYKNDIISLYTLFVEGKLDEEIAVLREEAIATNVNTI